MKNAPKTLTIEGGAIKGIASFYDEINRVFMLREDWKLAQSLDALDDLLYGGFGAIDGSEPIILIWRDFERAKAALGVEPTRAYYLARVRTH
jgi:RNAse (barnase) inhibitor barstar